MNSESNALFPTVFVTDFHPAHISSPPENLPGVIVRAWDGRDPDEAYPADRDVPPIPC